jgi:hypothetical protein
MGGHGSGQYQSYDAKYRVEDCLILSMTTFHRAGIYWDMSAEGTVTEGKSKLGFSLHNNVLAVSYTLMKGKNAGRDMRYGIRIARTTPYFGGSRLWFLCPHCWRRSGKLYLAPGQIYYLCRGCARLTYQSTREMSRAKLRRWIMLEDARIQRLWQKVNAQP